MTGTEHTKDSDCTVGEDGCCVECGVIHGGEPCLICKGTAFHVSPCPESDADYDRINETLASAETAFWEAVRKAFPEIKTGDFSPDATQTLNQALRDALIEWLTVNHPKRG